jgi:hypothetical protein
LTDLLEEWKAQHGGDPTSTPTLTRTRTATPTGTIGAPTATPTATATKLPCANKPKAPALTAPTDGETVNGKQALLDWNDVNCANKYRVLVREGSPQGDKVESKAVTASQYKTKKLERGKNYAWRVRACNDQGCRVSKWWSFTTKE